MYAWDTSLHVFGPSALRAAVPVEETSLQYFGGLAVWRRGLGYNKEAVWLWDHKTELE